MQTHPDEPWTSPPVTPGPPYALGAKVAQRPYYRPTAWQDVWDPAPYRVIGRVETAFLDGRTWREYFVQSWTLTGHWAIDRPAKVDEGRIKLWEEI